MDANVANIWIGDILAIDTRSACETATHLWTDLVGSCVDAIGKVTTHATQGACDTAGNTWVEAGTVRVDGGQNVAITSGVRTDMTAQDLAIDAATTTFTSDSFDVTTTSSIDLGVGPTADPADRTARMSIGAGAGTCRGADASTSGDCSVGGGTWTEGVVIEADDSVTLEGGEVEIKSTNGDLEFTGGTGLSLTTVDGPIDISSHQTSSTIGTVIAQVGTGGVNDATVGGYYTGTADGDIEIEISGTGGNADSFRWRFVENSVPGAYSADISITAGQDMPVVDGVTVTFAQNVGHGGSEIWTVGVTAGVGADTTIEGTTVSMTASAGNLALSADNVAEISAREVEITGQDGATITSTHGDIHLCGG
jgi:hypothetical protein